MPAEERDPDLRQARNVARSRGLAQSLATPLDRVRRLQTSLQAKAKAEPAFRFYTLWDKVCREDVLSEAYGACRRNGGVAGVDGETFAAIETAGRKRWLEGCGRSSRPANTDPSPLARVDSEEHAATPAGHSVHPRSRGRDGGADGAGSHLEADLLPQQFGFRPGRDAKTAVRRAFWHITDHGRTEVVDADLSDYFASIPHGPLMRCVSRRVADGTILAVIKAWLTVPVVERVRRTTRHDTEARDVIVEPRRVPPISPRWRTILPTFPLAGSVGHRGQARAPVFNYADDCHLLPTRQRAGGPGGNAQLMTHWADVNEARPADRCRGKLRLSRLRSAVLRQGRLPDIAPPSRKRSAAIQRIHDEPCHDGIAPVPQSGW